MVARCATDQPKFLTKEGLLLLGRLIRYCREARGWSLDDLAAIIAAKFPDTAPSAKTIANIELAVAAKQPDYNNLSAIAAVGFVVDLQSGRSLTIDDFIDIASEQRDVLVPPEGKKKSTRVSGITMDDFIQEIYSVIRQKGQTPEEFAQEVFSQERSNISKLDRLQKILNKESDLDNKVDWGDIMIVALSVPSFVNSDRNVGKLKSKLKGLRPASGGSNADLDGDSNGRRPNLRVRC